MQTVKIKRDELLEVVKKNRAAHRQIFEEAQGGYRKAVIKELDAMLAEARSGKRIRRTVSLVEPVDQTREYDRVIRMLEMSADDTVELQNHEFAQYVMDDWTWKRAFLASNMHYSKLANDTVAAMEQANSALPE